MEIVRHRFETDDEQHIAHIGDIHAGIRDSDIGRASEAFEMVAERENTWLLGMGDYCEFRPPDHEFYSSEECTMRLDEQLTWLFENIGPCAANTIGLLIGNHEGKLSRKLTMNPIRRWCDDNAVPFLGMMAKITYEFPCGAEYSMIVHHGYGGGRKAGGKVNMLTDFISRHDVDSVVVGHVHQLFDWVETELEYPNDTVVHRYKYCGMSGTFLRTYTVGASGYAEAEMMEPVPLGFLMTHISPDNGIKMEKVLL